MVLILITYSIFLEFIEIKIEDRVEDWIWKLRMYFTYGMNSQNLPRFSGINSKKKNKGNEGCPEL